MATDDREDETRVYRYLYGLAGLTEQEVPDLLESAGVPLPMQEPEPEAYAAVDAVFGTPMPGSAVWANDLLVARQRRLALVFTQIRVALREKARRTERPN